jgi:hypothetical protein
MPISKNAYLILSEMQENANYIRGYLENEGWTLQAISGMLGNMQTESTINPGIWQNLQVNVKNGFGLTQWTPATKLINWAKDEGLSYNGIDTQLQRILYEVPREGLQWIKTKAYPLSFEEFTHSEETPAYLAQAFLKNYERPKNQNQPKRSTQATYWYKWLSGEEPPTPPTPPKPGPTRSKMPFIFYLRKRW